MKMKPEITKIKPKITKINPKIMTKPKTTPKVRLKIKPKIM